MVATDRVAYILNPSIQRAQFLRNPSIITIIALDKYCFIVEIKDMYMIKHHSSYSLSPMTTLSLYLQALINVVLIQRK